MKKLIIISYFAPMKYVVLLIISNLLSQPLLLAQDGRYHFGGRSAGMANASITLKDPYSIFNNIGGVSEVKEISAFMGYRSLFGLSALNSIGAGVIKPLNAGNVALSFYRFGGDLFSQQKVSVGFGNRLGLVSLGANLSYMQYHIETLGKSSSFVLEIGGVAEITEKLRFAAYAFNVNQATLSGSSDQTVPVLMKTGIGFEATKALFISTEVEKEVDSEARFRLGLEYAVIPHLFLRTGIESAIASTIASATESSPAKASFGIGFQPKRFHIDYAYGNHSILGDVHDFSMAIELGK